VKSNHTSGHYSVPLVQSLSNCSTSMLTQVMINSDCPLSSYTIESLVAAFSLSCNSESEEQYLWVIAIPCFLVVAGMMLAIFVPQVRRKIFPYRDRKQLAVTQTVVNGRAPDQMSRKESFANNDVVTGDGAENEVRRRNSSRNSLDGDQLTPMRKEINSEVSVQVSDSE